MGVWVCRGVTRSIERKGKEMNKFVVTPTVSSRLLLCEMAATCTNCTER